MLLLRFTIAHYESNKDFKWEKWYNFRVVWRDCNATSIHNRNGWPRCSTRNLTRPVSASQARMSKVLLWPDQGNPWTSSTSEEENQHYCGITKYVPSCHYTSSRGPTKYMIYTRPLEVFPFVRTSSTQVLQSSASGSNVAISVTIVTRASWGGVCADDIASNASSFSAGSWKIYSLLWYVSSLPKLKRGRIYPFTWEKRLFSWSSNSHRTRAMPSWSPTLRPLENFTGYSLYAVVVMMVCSVRIYFRMYPRIVGSLVPMFPDWRTACLKERSLARRVVVLFLCSSRGLLAS